MLTPPGEFIKPVRTQGVVTFARQVVTPACAEPETARQTGKKTTGESYADPAR